MIPHTFIIPLAIEDGRGMVHMWSYDYVLTKFELIYVSCNLKFYIYIKIYKKKNEENLISCLF